MSISTVSSLLKSKSFTSLICVIDKFEFLKRCFLLTMSIELIESVFEGSFSVCRFILGWDLYC